MSTVLVGKTKQGDFVHNSQTMGTAEGFKNVSRKWVQKCVSYETAMESLVKGHAETEDIIATVKEMVPTVNYKGEFVIEYVDGREFRPTAHSITNMATWANMGTWYATQLLTNPEDTKGRQLFARDRGDAETLVAALKNGFRRIDPEKKFMWRTRQDGTLRAMLTDKYAIINNEWFMDALKKIIPGGLCSHWKGDSDTIFGNVLIPDSSRQESDSDYGGMLSISNSEIGERNLSSLPSIFRAICMNGCIWDREMGDKIQVRHRGNINLDELFIRLKTNLEEQIPLLPQGIDKLLGIRTMGWDGGSMLPLFAQTARQFDLSKKQARSMIEGYSVEQAETPAGAKSLFGLVNAITRAGQKMPNMEWVKMDTIGGRLVNFSSGDWFSFTSRAKSLKTKEIQEVLSLSA
jgi:hypothetical protein